MRSDKTESLHIRQLTYRGLSIREVTRRRRAADGQREGERERERETVSERERLCQRERERQTEEERRRRRKAYFRNPIKET